MRKYQDFAVFVLIGGVSTLVNIVARVLLSGVFTYEVAIVLAFPIALGVAFTLNRLFVFRVSGKNWRGQLFRFLIVNLLALVQVFIISVLFARVIFPRVGMHFHPELLAHAIGLLSPIFTSYWAHRHFTFRAPAAVAPSVGSR